MLFYTMAMWEHRSALAVIRDSLGPVSKTRILKSFIVGWFSESIGKIGHVKWLFKLAEGIYILESSLCISSEVHCFTECSLQ